MKIKGRVKRDFEGRGGAVGGHDGTRLKVEDDGNAHSKILHLQSGLEGRGLMGHSGLGPCGKEKRRGRGKGKKGEKASGPGASCGPKQKKSFSFF